MGSALAFALAFGATDDDEGMLINVSASVQIKVLRATGVTGEGDSDLNLSGTSAPAIGLGDALGLRPGTEADRERSTGRELEAFAFEAVAVVCRSRRNKICWSMSSTCSQFCSVKASSRRRLSEAISALRSWASSLRVPRFFAVAPVY